jgi:hypothetical protein
MSRFIVETVSDMRSGRQSWRVYTSLSAAALGISLLQRFFW